MKSFKQFITEVEVNPQRSKPKDPLPFKEPQPKPLQTGPRRVRRKSSAGAGTTAEPASGSTRTTRTRTAALRPEYFDSDGNLRPEAPRIFADRKAGAGYSRAGERLTPERKAALDQVDDLFKRFDAGDADAASEVENIRNRIIQKHGAANKHPSFRDVTTGTSPAPSDSTTQQLRDMQGRRGQAQMDPALQQATSDRLSGQSTSQVIDNPGRPEQSVMDKTRAAGDARRAGVTDVGTRTPRPGVRTDDVLDAIRNVPDEPQLPRITGGQPRVTDKGTPTNPYTQAELKREIINRRGRKVELPSRPASPRPVTGPSLGSPTASGMTPMRAAQVAAARSATPQGATSVAGRLKSFRDFLKTTSQNTALARGLRVAGRGAQGVAFGMDAAQGYGDAKRRGADNFRATARGLVRGTGSLAGGTVGAVGGAFAGTAGGSFTGPGAVVTGALGAYGGGAAGSMMGGELADKAFQTVAGATDAEKELMRKRKRDSQVDVYGRGPQYTNARGGKAIVKDPKTRKARVGYLSYKDGKPVYTAPNDPSTLRYTSSNPVERVGRTLGQSGIPGLGNWLNTYYSQKDEKARIRDVNRQIQNSTSGRI